MGAELAPRFALLMLSPSLHLHPLLLTHTRANPQLSQQLVPEVSVQGRRLLLGQGGLLARLLSAQPQAGSDFAMSLSS